MKAGIRVSAFILASTIVLAMSVNANAQITSVTGSTTVSADQPITFGLHYSAGPYNGTLVSIAANPGFNSTINYGQDFDFYPYGDRLVVTIVNDNKYNWTGYDLFVGQALYPSGYYTGAVGESPASFSPPANTTVADVTQLSNGVTIDFTNFYSPIAPNQSFSLYFAAWNLNSNGGSFIFSGTAVPSAAPEPASWAMMLIGLGGVGGLLRRSFRKSRKLGMLLPMLPFSLG